MKPLQQAWLAFMMKNNCVCSLILETGRGNSGTSNSNTYPTQIIIVVVFTLLQTV